MPSELKSKVGPAGSVAAADDLCGHLSVGPGISLGPARKMLEDKRSKNARRTNLHLIGVGIRVAVMLESCRSPTVN